MLLALLDALGGMMGKLDFQKLLFLYTQEVEKVPSYEFIPYHYGAFSYTSYADKNRLIARGFLQDEEKHWRLTDSVARESVWSQVTGQDMDAFVARYKFLRGDDLVAQSYRKYPYYAINSKMADRILSNDAQALRAIQEAKPSPFMPGLCTIGYEGKSLENYINRLITGGVNLLCDVRRNPLSRKYGFSKATLSRACEGVGIRYEHLPELGIASEERRNLKTQADYDALFSVYDRRCLPIQSDALQTIQSWVNSGYRVALTCYEQHHEQCHRSRVARALEMRAGADMTTLHL